MTSGEARNVVGGSSRLMWKTNTDASNELRFRYVNYDTGSSAKNLFVSGRYTTAGDRVGLLLWPDRMLLQQYVASTNTWTTLDYDLAAGSTQGQAYDVRMEMDGANVKVWRDGALLLESTAATVTTTDTVRFQSSANASFGVDNVMFLAGSLSRSTTLAVNTANELTGLTDYNGSTSYSYDELGRMISKTRGGSSAAYSWHYDDRLTKVNSNFPGEGVVDYNYSANGDRRTRTYNSVTTTYNWDGAFNVQSEENSGGSLTRTYVGRTMAHIDGATPSSGTYSYYTHDHLFSTRGIHDMSKNMTSAYEYSPYGDPYLLTNVSATTRLYTGHDLDTMTGLYFTAFRYYGLGMGRWVSQDPLAMVDGPNVHIYGAQNPIRYIDLLGLSVLGCFGKGLVGGLIGGAVVAGAAALAVGTGVVSAPVVTGGLVVAAAVGGALLLYDSITNPSKENLAENAGSLLGGSLVGGGTGRGIGGKLTGGKPLSGWKDFFKGADFGKLFDPKMGSTKDWMSTGPTGPMAQSAIATSGGAAGGSDCD